MRDITLKIYKFSELSDKAKERAKADFQTMNSYSMSGEALDSLQKLAEHFGGKMTDWQIDWFAGSYSSAEFDMPEMDKSEIQERLNRLGEYNPETLKGNGECLLTGCCTDEDAIDGFRMAFMRDGVTDLERLMQAAFVTWLKAQQSACEEEYTDAHFSETADANDYEYYDTGEQV